MRKNLIFCLISALVGGALATVLSNQPNPSDRIAAAEPPRGEAPLVAQAGTATGGQVPVVARPQRPVEDDLTIEERVNVAVYENVNRSVVNIVTKIPGTAGLLMFNNSQTKRGPGPARC